MKFEDNKYHRAAIDGYVDMLCEASRRDTNLANLSNGFTPTLLAAHNGHLDALRILVGRGGNPEKTTPDGSSALHLAAARNHLNCVSFLVNFGVNMWALNNELHTAKDLAAMEQRKEILDYLDQMMAKQSALNTRQVQKFKEKAKLAAEKRLKEMRKRQLKAIKQVEKDERYLIKLSNNRRLLKAAHSISDIKLVGRSSNNFLDSSKLMINYSPSTSTSTSSSSSSSTSTSTSTSIITSDSNKIRLAKNSTSISNNNLSHIISKQQQQKVLLDLNRYSNHKPICFVNYRSKIAHNSTQASQNFSSSSNSQSSSSDPDDSSTSGYLSSCTSGGGSTASVLKLIANNNNNYKSNQPKYSDLVALNNKTTTSDNDKDLKDEREDQKQQSLKSNSTIGIRLRGIGGISRKVQLKRMMLLTSSSSSSNQSNSTNDLTSSTDSSPAKVAETISTNNKLCNVRPAIKLKFLNSADSSRTTTTSSNQIKWPPAPTMTRAVSEPDFNNVAFNNNHEDSEDASSSSAGKVDNVSSSSSSAEVGQENSKFQQHQLLTQCLSQLKTKHNEATRNRNRLINKEDNEDVLHSSQQNEKPPSPQLTKSLMTKRQQLAISGQQTTQTAQAHLNRQQQAAILNSSDELLQHQLTAGQCPLKPSIIKQQQQATKCGGGAGNTTTTIRSAATSAQHGDSIGSAGSLAKRNSTTSTGESASYSPSYFNDDNDQSSQVNQVDGDNNNDKNIQQFCLQQQQFDNDQLNQKNQNQETIETFLRVNGLIDLNEVFARERIDLEALVLLSEDDLKSLNILLGPRRKLLKAIENRRLLIQSSISKPMYIMVDTPL